MAVISRGSSHHLITCVGPDDYEVSWRVDFEHQGTRRRFSRMSRRRTDEKGAQRFAKRWRAAMPSVVDGALKSI